MNQQAESYQASMGIREADKFNDVVCISEDQSAILLQAKFIRKPTKLTFETFLRKILKHTSRDCKLTGLANNRLFG
jgi:hypothetical protein